MLAYKEKIVWESLLQRQGNPLAAVKVGGRVAFMAKEDLAEPDKTEMVLWERQEGGVAVAKQAFQGFRSSDADIMLVAEAGVLLRVCEELSEDPIKTMRQGIRHGSVICYFLRPKRELIDMGYEEFVELLGLPLAGCQ